MSYIEREKATDYFMKLATGGKLTDDKYAEGLTRAFLTAAHYAQNLAPDADVEPIRHGEWIDKGDANYYCSECDGAVRHNYPNCPFCRAKMDKGET